MLNQNGITCQSIISSLSCWKKFDMFVVELLEGVSEKNKLS